MSRIPEQGRELQIVNNDGSALLEIGKIYRLGHMLVCLDVVPVEPGQDEESALRIAEIVVERCKQNNLSIEIFERRGRHGTRYHETKRPDFVMVLVEEAEQFLRIIHGVVLSVTSENIRARFASISHA